MKPSYRYVCPCGFRTNKPWRWKGHTHGKRGKDARKPAGKA
jgi:hypothetical protein